MPSSLWFANPWGFLALLAIPAIVAIHFLHRRTRRFDVSTLFLVREAFPPVEGGRRFSRLRGSPAMWLQILAAILLAWCLAQPRWVRSGTRQTVVVILDNAASMRAFREPALAAIRRRLPALAGSAASTRWVLLTSNGETLSSSGDLQHALDALGAWDPLLPVHDRTPVFQTAAALARDGGAVLFFTDHPPEKDDPQIDWVSVGRPLDNVGIAGARAGEASADWTAVVRNYCDHPQTRGWSVRAPGRQQPNDAKQTLMFQPNETKVLHGLMPDGANRVELALDGDAFDLDDMAPVLRPVRKPLRASVEGDAPAWLDKALRAMDAEKSESGEADVVLAVYDPLSAKTPRGAAILFGSDPARRDKWLEGEIASENEPLAAGLNWQGLIAPDSFGIPFKSGDRALVWQGGRPILFVRRTASGPQQLVFNFDVSRSNAARLPAFPILLHRFAGELRSRKRAFESGNVETGQEICVAGAGVVSAPLKPQFFEISDADGTPAFAGAAHLADARISDFRSAAPWGKSPAASRAAVREASSDKDVLAPLWLLAAAGCMLASWLASGRARQPASRSSGAAHASLSP